MNHKTSQQTRRPNGLLGKPRSAVVIGLQLIMIGLWVAYNFCGYQVTKFFNWKIRGYEMPEHFTVGLWLSVFSCYHERKIRPIVCLGFPKIQC